MKSRTYTYISRFISRLPREFMLRFPQTSVLNICFSHVAPLQTPKGKANVRATKRPRQSQRATCAHQTAVLGRLPLPAAPRATRAGSASLHQLRRAMLRQQLRTHCAAQAQPARPSHLQERALVAAAPLPRRCRAAVSHHSRVAAAPLLSRRRTTPAPPVSVLPAHRQGSHGLAWPCVGARVARETRQRQRQRQTHTERRQQEGERACTQRGWPAARPACVDISALHSRQRVSSHV